MWWWDQLPISGSEKITVELVEPRIRKKPEAVQINEDKFIEWHFMLQPNEEKTVPFRFYVEAPVGVVIGGLDVSALD